MDDLFDFIGDVFKAIFSAFRPSRRRRRHGR